MTDFRRLVIAGLVVQVSAAMGVSHMDKMEDRGVITNRVALWSGHAPTGDGKFVSADAYITVYRPANANGTAIIICPGGGYGCLVAAPEGHGIANWLNQHGIVGVVLEYRLPRGNPFVPLLDAQRAIRLVRSEGKSWDCDPGRIGIMGFSAGGHLAATAATHFDGGDLNSPDPVNKIYSRPDFAILIYPVITMGLMGHAGTRENLLGQTPGAGMMELFSGEKQVTDRTPPVFLAHAKDDSMVPPENSRLFFEALQTHHVAAKYLELPQGNHGLNGYKGPMWDAWQSQALQWLVAQKMMNRPE